MSEALNKTRRFLCGRFYPLFIGAVVLISHIFALEAICAPIIVGSCMLVLVLCDSAEYTIAPIVLFTYLLSRKHTPMTPSYSDYLLSPLPLTVIILMCVGLFAAIIYFFIKDKRYKRIKLKGEPVFASLLLFILTLFASALFSGEHILNNLAFAATEACAFIIPFLLFSFGIPKERAPGELCDRLSYVALISSAVIVLELLHLYITTDVFINGSLNKEAITLGWGIWNSVGGMLTLALPLLFLGAVRTRHTAIYLGAAVITYIAGVLTLSRNALLFGTLIFGVCCIICATVGEKKKLFRWFLLSLVCVLAVFLLIFGSKIADVLADYINRGFSDNGRFALWKDSVSAFLENVFTGVGFHAYSGDYYQFAAFMPKLPHNTPLALLGGGGILAFAAYAVYRIYTALPFIKRPSLYKTLLGLTVLMLIMQSLLDNFIFNFYPTFMYTAAICIAQRFGENADIH